MYVSTRHVEAPFSITRYNEQVVRSCRLRDLGLHGKQQCM